MHWLGGKKDSIPADVKRLVSSQLAESNFGSVDVAVDGRDVTLTGVVSSEDTKNQIIALAEDVTDAKGRVAPRVVNWAGEVKIPEPPKPVMLKDGSINATVKDGVITLTGALGSQQQVDAALASAYAKFGANNVVNRLTVGENIKPISGLNGLLSGLDIENGALSLSGQQINLTGEVADDATKLGIAGSVAKALGSNFSVNNLLTVVVPEPEVPEVNLVCQSELKTLMGASKIFFETSSAVIKSDSNALLGKIAGILSQCPDASFVVEGHTDASGGEELNLDLSKRRAQSVVNYLVGKGVEVNNLTSIGYGESKPIATNASREGRAQNRRIEFTVK